MHQLLAFIVKKGIYLQPHTLDNSLLIVLTIRETKTDFWVYSEFGFTTEQLCFKSQRKLFPETANLRVTSNNNAHNFNIKHYKAPGLPEQISTPE